MSGVKKNFAYQSFYEVFAIILPLITSPYISRVLGAEKIGIYSYTYAIAYYFMMFALLGIKNHGNREIARARENREELNKTFSSLLIVHCFFSLIAVVAYYAYVAFFVTEDKLCAYLQGFWVLSALFDVSWFFFGIEQFKLTVLRNTLVKILMVVCIFLFVKTPEDIWIYVAIMAVGTFLSQVALWPFLKKYVDFRLVEWKSVTPHIWPMFLLFIPAIAVGLYKYMDKIMLGVLCDKVQVGFYENAERAINIPISIIGAFGTVMLPKMSNLAAKGDKQQEERYMLLSMEFVMCLTCAMAFGMAAVSTNFSVFFWGAEFEECGPLISALCVSVLFVAFANVIRMQYLIPKGKNAAFIISVFAGAIVNLIFNAILIPHMAALGAAVGTVMAEVAVCVVQAIFICRERPVMTYVKNSVFFFILAGLMYIIVLAVGNLLEQGVIALCVQICVGAIVYAIGCFIYFVYIKKNSTVISIIDKIKGRCK